MTAYLRVNGPTIAAEDTRISLADLLHNNAPWMVAGLCAQTDPEAFYPEKGGSTREAKKVCAMCPVQADCLQHALEHNERFGIWGGLSERERRKLTYRPGGQPTWEVAPRTCQLAECNIPIPIDAHGNQRFCSLSHAEIARQRRYAAARNDPERNTA